MEEGSSFWIAATCSALVLLVFFIYRSSRWALKCQIAEEKGARLEETEQILKSKEEELLTLKVHLGIAEERLSSMQEAHEHLRETFKALSADALERNNRVFLDLAKTTLEKVQEGARGELAKKEQVITDLVRPVKETLEKLDLGMRQLEKERKGEQEALKQQMGSLIETEKEVRLETSRLVRALRAPVARGQWGEIQLRRVVELAGMLSHCDFYEQQQDMGQEGWIRPDLIVRLPGSRQVIIDAKVPLAAYLDAVELQDDAAKEGKLKEHARHVRGHILALSKKSYWQHFQPTPEFVVLFLPTESLFSAALEYDPSLIELGVEEGVILATPTTLIALLRAVAYGWKQESFSRHAEEVCALGQELYKRILDMSQYWSKMGRSLSGALEAYNKAVGSLESRVLVTARKLSEMGITASSEIEELERIEKFPRELQNPKETSLGEQKADLTLRQEDTRF